MCQQDDSKWEGFPIRMGLIRRCNNNHCHLNLNIAINLFYHYRAGCLVHIGRFINGGYLIHVYSTVHDLHTYSKKEKCYTIPVRKNYTYLHAYTFSWSQKGSYYVICNIIMNMYDAKIANTYCMVFSKE